MKDSFNSIRYYNNQKFNPLLILSVKTLKISRIPSLFENRVWFICFKHDFLVGKSKGNLSYKKIVFGPFDPKHDFFLDLY